MVTLYYGSSNQSPEIIVITIIVEKKISIECDVIWCHTLHIGVPNNEVAATLVSQPNPVVIKPVSEEAL